MSSWAHLLKSMVLFIESCRWLRLKSPFIADMIDLDLAFTIDQKFLHESSDKIFFGHSQQSFLTVSVESEYLSEERDKFYVLQLIFCCRNLWMNRVDVVLWLVFLRSEPIDAAKLGCYNRYRQDNSLSIVDIQSEDFPMRFQVSKNCLYLCATTTAFNACLVMFIYST